MITEHVKCNNMTSNRFLWKKLTEKIILEKITLEYVFESLFKLSM